jgi:hypothetical protein
MKNENEMKFIPTVDTSKETVNEMFSKIVQQQLQDGALEKALKNKIDELFDNCVRDAFGYNSDIRKALESTIKNAISPNLTNLGTFPKYHQLVMSSITNAATKFQNEKLQAVIDKELEAVFKEIPEKLTLTWILEQIKLETQEKEGEEFESGELALFIKTSSCGYSHIYIGREEGMSYYSCEYQIDITDKGEIYSLKIDGNDKGNPLTVGNLYSFQKLLFNAYVMKSTIILDKGTEAYEYDLEMESNLDDY